MLAAKSLRWPTWHWELQHRLCLNLTYVVRFVCVYFGGHLNVRLFVWVRAYVHMHAGLVSWTHTPFACRDWCTGPHPHIHTILSSPLLLSCVDEIRWFLLGKAAVHPSAAPPCARPTANAQVTTHLTVTRPLHLCLLPHPLYVHWTFPHTYTHTHTHTHTTPRQHKVICTRTSQP